MPADATEGVAEVEHSSRLQPSIINQFACPSQLQSICSAAPVPMYYSWKDEGSGKPKPCAVIEAS